MYWHLICQSPSRNSETRMRPLIIRALRLSSFSILFQKATLKSKSCAMAVPSTSMSKSLTSSASKRLLFSWSRSWKARPVPRPSGLCDRPSPRRRFLGTDVCRERPGPLPASPCRSPGSYAGFFRAKPVDRDHGRALNLDRSATCRKRLPSEASSARRFLRNASSSHITITSSKNRSTTARRLASRVSASA